MRIIANTNTNELTNSLYIYISESVTINDLIEHSEEIFEFFNMPAHTPSDILEYLDSIDGLDVGAIRNPGSLLIDNDTVLEFNAFGCTENLKESNGSDREEPAETGSVTVTISGSFAHKSVAVTNNVTRVGDLITDNLADFFATTRCALSNMSIRINDVEAASTDTVKAGDIVTFEVRKAGSKGSVLQVNVYREGETKAYACCPGDTLQMFVDTLSESLGEDVKVKKLNGHYIPSAFYDAVLKSTYMKNGDSIHLWDPEDECEDESADQQGYDNDMDNGEVSEDCGEEEHEETCDHERTSGKAFGAVTVVLPGGFNKIKIAISDGETNVNDVVMSTKVWDALAMNSAQVASLVFHVNDVEVSLEDSLEDGDVLSISARKAGSKGC